MATERVTDEVVAAAQAGDPGAMRAIYQEYSPVVLGYLTARGVGDPEAVTSDVFLAVLRRLPDLTGGADGVRHFILSVAHARMVDDVRRRRRRPVTVPFEPQADVRVADSAETDAMRGLSTAAVLKLVDRLVPAQRDVLLLRVVADLSIEEVAAIMGKSRGAVKQLQHRALSTLRELLAGGP